MLVVQIGDVLRRRVDLLERRIPHRRQVDHAQGGDAAEPRDQRRRQRRIALRGGGRLLLRLSDDRLELRPVIKIQLRLARLARAIKKLTQLLSEQVIAGANHLVGVAEAHLLDRALDARLPVLLDALLIETLVILGRGLAEHIPQLRGGVLRLRRHGDLRQAERDVPSRVVPRLTIPAVTLQRPQALHVLADLGVHIPLRERLLELRTLDLRSLESLSGDVSVNRRGLLSQRRLAGASRVQLRPHGGGGDGGEEALRDRHLGAMIVLLVDRTRQAKNARQIEHRVSLEATLLRHAQDRQLPAVQDTLGILRRDGGFQLPARMQATTGVDDRDGADAEDQGELGDGPVDLSRVGRVLAVEVRIQDAHTGDVGGLGPLVTRRRLHRLSADPGVLRGEETGGVLEVEVIDRDRAGDPHALGGDGDVVIRLKPQE